MTDEQDSKRASSGTTSGEVPPLNNQPPTMPGIPEKTQAPGKNSPEQPGGLARGTGHELEPDHEDGFRRRGTSPADGDMDGPLGKAQPTLSDETTNGSTLRQQFEKSSDFTKELLKIMGVHNIDEAYSKVWERVCRDYSKFDIDRPFKPWLRGIITNVAYEDWRENAKRKKEDLLEASSSEVEGGPSLELRSSSVDPETVAVIQETLRDVLTVLEGLPERYRKIFLLHRLGIEEIPREGILSDESKVSPLSHKELAKMFDTTEANSRKIVERVLGKLRELQTPTGDPPPPPMAKKR